MSLTAGMYPNTPNRQQEELEKNAEAELFVKIAASQGIDLNTLNDEEVSALYAYTFNKEAEFPPPEDKKEEGKDKGEGKDDEDEEKKKESAAREHETKLAYAREMEMADKLGRHMAHCYIDELNKVGSALIAQQGGAQQTPEQPATETKEAAMPEHLAKALGKVKSVAGKASDAARSGAFSAGLKAHDAGRFLKNKAEHAASAVGKAVKEHPGRTAAGAAAAGAGAGFAAGRAGKKKESSAIDQLAIEAAVKMAHEAGLDVDEASDKVAGVFLLGLDESTKVAATLEQQIEIRALEYLEAAGYPVTWAS